MPAGCANRRNTGCWPAIFLPVEARNGTELALALGVYSAAAAVAGAGVITTIAAATGRPAGGSAAALATGGHRQQRRNRRGQRCYSLAGTGRLAGIINCAGTSVSARQCGGNAGIWSRSDAGGRFVRQYGNRRHAMGKPSG